MKPTFYERALSIISPDAASRRFKARRAFESLRSYESADKGRLSDGWQRLTGSGTSADAEIGKAGSTIRDRSRFLVRNNPHAAKALAVLVNNIIGNGIVPRADTGSDATDKRINELFDTWSSQCDYDGQLDFYGLQTLAVREMLESGEILVRARPKGAKNKLLVPLKLQLLEADFIDASKNGELNGGYAVQGIQFNSKDDTRAGYWLFNRHPGATSLMGTNKSELVKAEEIAHLYEKQRTQARGVPWLSPVIRSLDDLDGYELSESMRKKMEACLVAMVTSEDDEIGITDPKVVNARGDLIEKFSPGMIAYLRGGKDIKFNQPSATAGYAEYKKAALQTISAGARVPYELLTNDLSQVNFSSARVGLVDFRRMCEAIQWQIIIPMFCQPIWNWFCVYASLSKGAELQDFVNVVWSPPKFESVTPLEDAQTDLIKMRLGTMTFAQAVEKEGYSWLKQVDEIQACNVKLDSAGVKLDSDPRQLTKTGILQTDQVELAKLKAEEGTNDNTDAESDKKPV